MTAGRGIVHAEMPRQNPDGSANVGIQLWVDLPTKLKACEPRYRDLRSAEVPVADIDDGKATIKVISGQSHGIDSVKDLAYTPVWILDVQLRPGASVTQPLPDEWNAFAYVLEGDVLIGEGDSRQPVEQYNIAVFEQTGKAVHVELPEDAEKSARIGMSKPTPFPYLYYSQAQKTNTTKSSSPASLSTNPSSNTAPSFSPQKKKFTKLYLTTKLTPTALSAQKTGRAK